jgi:hypothetical protein
VRVTCKLYDDPNENVNKTFRKIHCAGTKKNNSMCLSN